MAARVSVVMIRRDRAQRGGAELELLRSTSRKSRAVALTDMLATWIFLWIGQCIFSRLFDAKVKLVC